MSENTVEPTATETVPAPAAAAPAEQVATPPARKSLEDLLGSLDEDARGVILGEVSKARSEAKNLRDRLRDAEPKLTEWQALQEASQSETQRAQNLAAAAQAQVEKLRTRAVEAEVKAFASSTFADPTDATAFIDPANYINDDGEIDTEGIQSDLADLLARKPHLGKAPGGRTPAPNPAQGASANGATPAPRQLTKADLERMSQAGQFDEIAAARAAGQFNDLLGIKP